MKVRYLPKDDKQNIKILKKTQDRQVIIDTLNSMFKRPYTLQALYEYRTWYEMLTQEELDQYPSLKTGFIQIKVMQGELEQAQAMIETLEDNSLYKIHSKIMTPSKIDEFMEDVKKIKDFGVRKSLNMTITAGRPSIISGIWDFCPLLDKIYENPRYLEESFRTMFGDKAELISETLMIETLYQRDECYEALVKIVGILPMLRDRKDMRLLLVVLTHEMFIMTLNNQGVSFEPIIESLRKQITGVGLEEYTPNIDALEAWCSMYEGDYKKIARWLREGAPDEYTRFSTLDTFRYMVKIRAYLIQEKHLAITYLATKLNLILDQGFRYKDMCELHTLWAISDYARKDKASAFSHLEIALDIASKYRLDRMIADEGMRIYEVLMDYKKEKGTNPYLERQIELTKKVALSHPNYLKPQLPEKPSLTPAELNVLRLIEAGHSNAEIAELTGTTIDNAKFHCKKIFNKLEVSSRYQAVKKAIELGIIETTNI